MTMTVQELTDRMDALLEGGRTVEVSILDNDDVRVRLLAYDVERGRPTDEVLDERVFVADEQPEDDPDNVAVTAERLWEAVEEMAFA
jgi:hypothetical protein